jgi:hypothetical protein
LLVLAVNVVNGWSLDDIDSVPCSRPAGLEPMLADLYRQLLEGNRLVLERQGVRRKLRPVLH